MTWEDCFMFVYIDESGNTGKNIADKKHPIFYHMALLSKGNLDFDYRIECFLERHKIKELHAIENQRLLEELSPIVLTILKENSVSFYYAEIQKSYLAYAKLYDTLFDSVENMGARWSSYQIRSLRLMLLCNLIGIIDEAVAFDFYKNCLMANSQQQAEDSLRSVCKHILSETHKLKDPRSKEIIEDAINGAKYYCHDISMFEETKQDRWRHLPHIVSFLPMLNSISHYSKLQKSKIDKIIHDEQEQIQHVITEMHDVAAKSGKTGNIWDLRENGFFDFTNIPEQSFEMKDSKNSYGIQITDICLSILVHGIPNSNYEPAKYELYTYVSNHFIDFFLFNTETLQIEANEWYKKIMNANIPLEDIEKGKEFINKMDEDFYEKNKGVPLKNKQK